MKKLVLVLGFIILLLAGCSKTNDSVSIKTDVDSYTPAMSSVQGITMTPDCKTQKEYGELVYHWKAEQGEFIGKGKDVKNQGEAVLWSAIENDKVKEIKKPFNITLEVIDSESHKKLASTKLTITYSNFFYKVKK